MDFDHQCALDLLTSAVNFTLASRLKSKFDCVSGAFVVCWTPGLVILLLDGLHCTKCHVTKLKRWLLLLAVLNSVMNPCIYSYKDEEMWMTIKNLACCIGNGTRRQRSTKANTRPLSSAQDTGNSQVPSEEMKNDSDILKS